MPELLVQRADAIVMATALSYVQQPDSHGAGGIIEFDINETLKSNVVGSLKIDGILIEKDDFNDIPVPYTFVRFWGRMGSCFARAYQVGGQFLLLLKRTPEGQLTPYWEPLAPTNEQVRGFADPWVVWVRQHR